MMKAINVMVANAKTVVLEESEVAAGLEVVEGVCVGEDVGASVGTGVGAGVGGDVGEGVGAEVGPEVGALPLKTSQ